MPGQPYAGPWANLPQLRGRLALELLAHFPDEFRDVIGARAFRRSQSLYGDPGRICGERCEATLFGMRDDGGELEKLVRDCRVEFGFLNLRAAASRRLLPPSSKRLEELVHQARNLAPVLRPQKYGSRTVQIR